MSNAPLTLEQVAATADDAWLNDGFSAVVSSIEPKTTGPTSRRPNSKFWVVTLASQTGPDTAEWSLFTAPKFGQGDLIDVTGKGIKRKVDAYNGGIKIQAGDKAVITVVGKSAHHEEQQERKATGAPSVSGQLQHIQGQTVGMALKEAMALHSRHASNGEELQSWLDQPEFWAAVYTTASDVIRVSQLLEKGKLAPSARERANPTPAAQPEPAPNGGRPAAPSTGGRADTPKAGKPQPGPGGNAFPEDNGEDVPF